MAKIKIGIIGTGGFIVKKIIVFLFIFTVFINFINIFTACSKPDTAEKNDISQSQNIGVNEGPDINSGAENVPVLPDVKFDGYEFRILNSTPEAIHWMTVQIHAAEETGDVFNDEIYRRNSIIEEAYGIKIVEISVGGTGAGAGIGEIKNQAQKSIISDSNDYDLVMLPSFGSLELLIQRMFLDFNEIPYIDLSKPWWDQNLIKDITLADKLYIAPGDLSLSHYSTTMNLTFNKDLIRDYALDDPYRLVRENKWTLGKFFEMMKSCSQDLNGDGIYDKEDLYGLSALHFTIIPSVSIGAGMEYISKSINDLPVFAMDNPLFVERFSNVIAGLFESGPILYNPASKNLPHVYIIEVFEKNQALFYIEVLHNAHYFRAIDADVGFLPHPKYDEAQKNYITLVLDATYMAVPITSADLERTGIILEALCAESRKRVIPAYYDKMLKTKLARDEESGEMLDIMFSTRRSDLATIYWSSLIMGPISENIGIKRDYNIASFIEKNKPKIESEISKIADAFINPSSDN